MIIHFLYFKNDQTRLDNDDMEVVHEAVNELADNGKNNNDDGITNNKNKSNSNNDNDNNNNNNNNDNNDDNGEEQPSSNSANKDPSSDQNNNGGERDKVNKHGIKSYYIINSKCYQYLTITLLLGSKRSLRLRSGNRK